MLPAIKFDDEPPAMASKIGDIPPKWNLAAEVQAFIPQHTEFLPEFPFGVRCVAPQVASEMIGHLPPPTPNPSPQGGGERH